MRSAYLQQAKKPTVTARMQEMILRRSSSRWSRKLMAGMASWGCPAGGASAAISGIGGLGGRIQFGAGHGFGLVVSGGYRAHGRLGGRQDGLAVGFHVQLRNLRFDLRLELIGGTPELVERPPDLAPDLRQLLGPEDDQGQQEDEKHLWKAQVHGLNDTAGANCHQSGGETRQPPYPREIGRAHV